MEKRDTRGIIYLGEKSEELNQLVYASQLYGTFFTVYAVIKTSAGRSEKERQITAITCHILNYKGVLNIGLEDVVYNPETGQIDLHLKALGNTTELVSCRGLENFQKSAFEILEFRRRLEYLPEPFNKGVFEMEEYYRDGYFITKRPDYDAMQDQNEAPTVFAPSGRCMMSELKVLI